MNNILLLHNWCVVVLLLLPAISDSGSPGTESAAISAMRCRSAAFTVPLKLGAKRLNRSVRIKEGSSGDLFQERPD
jgi:hypothetical protein